MGLNLDWVKSYDHKCSLRHRASSANSQKIATAKWPRKDHAWLFFANHENNQLLLCCYVCSLIYNSYVVSVTSRSL